MMMNTGQRVELVRLRAQEKRRKQEKHQAHRLSLLSATLCCCLVAALRHFSGRAIGGVQGLSGATMLLQNAGGYVLVGVSCFIAAVVITVLCLRSREKNKKQAEQTKEEN